MGDSVAVNLQDPTTSNMQPMEIENVCINISSSSPSEHCISPQHNQLCSPSEHCIFRVHNQLRTANADAYEPGLIAIGPYHRGKENLKDMEKQKELYFLSLLNRRSEDGKNRYLEAVRESEEKAREFYAEPSELSADEFTQMLLFDGCFIVELMRKSSNRTLRDAKDPIFEMKWKMDRLKRDLILFENQIPFFVLFKLFNMSAEPNQEKGFIELAMEFFSDLLPGSGCLERERDDWQNQTRHLLEMIYDNWLPLYALDAAKNEGDWKLIHCASELGESGVKFQKADEDEESCLLDIKFANGTIQMPCITIKATTECFLRNLIAYEEYNQHIHCSHIISYAKFLGCLIQSPKDVKILRRYRCIDNWIGDDAAVSEIVTKINHGVTAPTHLHFHYRDIFNEVNAYCDKRINVWMAKLRRRHLNSPWAVISVLVAFTLLLLSLIQTIYTSRSSK